MRRIVLSALGVSLLACSGLLGGGDDTDTTDTVVTDTTVPPPTPTDTTTTPPTTPTGDTGPTHTGPKSDFVPYAVSLNGGLGWDASTSSVRSLDLGGTPLASYLQLVIVSAAFFTDTDPDGDGYADPATYCFVDFTFRNGQAPQSALDTASTYRVVDHSGDPADVSTTCDPAQYPMDTWIGPGVDLVDFLLNDPSHAWAIGVGQLSSAMIAQFDAEGLTASDYAALVGGRAFNATHFFGPGLADDIFFVFPVRVDPATFEPVYDGAYLSLIPVAQVSNGTNLATGWYMLRTLLYVEI